MSELGYAWTINSSVNKHSIEIINPFKQYVNKDVHAKILSSLSEEYDVVTVANGTTQILYINGVEVKV